MKITAIPAVSRLTHAQGNLLKPVSPAQSMAGIFKVKEADYIPHGLTLLSRTSPWVFSAQFPAHLIVHLKSDPKIEEFTCTLKNP